MRASAHDATEPSRVASALDPSSFDPVAYINTPRWLHSRLGLERIADLLDRLGNPQDSFDIVHVAGTNGKGSVCAYITSIVRQCGIRCGMFTSPYISRFEERIVVDGKCIPDGPLREITLEVAHHAEAMEAQGGKHPTEFELMTAVALEYFKQAKCQMAVLEVGLGGRMDSTNIVSPVLSVITRIGLDHTAILGDRIEQIAFEKAGIIKPRVPVTTLPQQPDAMRCIEEACSERDCELVVVDDASIDVGITDLGSATRSFSYKGVELQTSMLGVFQPINAALALESARVLSDKGLIKLDEDRMRRGIADARWPGRFEVIGRRPLVIVDGAHNPQGAIALRESLDEILGSGIMPTFVVGILKDKDYKSMIAALSPIAKRMIAFSPDNDRALDAKELADFIASSGACANVTSASSAKDAMRMAMEEEGPEGCIVAFGSLYSIASVKKAYKELR